MNDMKICPLCGEEYEGYGNNPAPLNVKGRVCDFCNLNEVIPARIKALGLEEVIVPQK